MDETVAETNMDATVPFAVKFAAGLVAEYLEGSVYVSGGALLPHESPDYDFLVVTQMSAADLLKYVVQLDHDIDEMTVVKIMESYNNQDDTWRMVVKLEYMQHNIDVLVIPTGYDVKDIMGSYPLSIQKQALWLAGPNLYGTHEVYHKDFTPPGDGLITVFSTGPAFEKYQKYYPDHAFLLVPGANGIV